MIMKILLWVFVMILSASVVFAQGLFSPEGGTSFAQFGILVVVFFFVAREIGKLFLNKKVIK